MNPLRVLQSFEPEDDMRENRECLIQILEDLETFLLGEVEWEIVPSRVPRAVMTLAIATAKAGPEPPEIDMGSEDFELDPFLALIADKSESSLFGMYARYG